MNQLTTVFIISLVVCFISSCSYDKAEEVVPSEPALCDTVQVDYTVDILPILEASCKFNGCHIGTTTAPYVMEPASELQDFTQNNTERFLAAIKHTGAFNMPKFGDKLPDSSITKLECWIEDGSPTD